ncbi:MAG: ribose-phosphate pyrophosphokinase [Candidatus Levybacteria bacterium CG10_big_fil_rev_8_21_14_0_10_35_13]|nr:MAG: ribose-phosphate pyrophosphokinase [Candidatus Levybacteria bacterium CG10_big_fil_rev_8_21_14_0_10_35_13]
MTTEGIDKNLQTPEAQQPPLAEAVFKSETIEILTGNSNPQLARDVGDLLAMGVDEPVGVFADGESRVQISKNLRRKEVFIIQSTSRPVNHSVMELILMIRAARRASADEVNAIIPYYGYARQDRKDQPRVTISGADVADILDTAGVDRILTIDLHAEQIQGVLDKPWDNLYASRVLLPAIQEFGTDNMIVVSPDVGGTKRAEKFSFLLNGTGEIAIVHKRRAEANKSQALAVIGDVEGRDVLLVDDIIDTAGTMCNAAKLLKDNGAQRIIIAATHGLFTSPALDRITDSSIDKVFVTDTVYLSDEVRRSEKVKVVTIAPLLADALKRIHTGDSLSALISKPTGK